MHSANAAKRLSSNALTVLLLVCSALTASGLQAQSFTDTVTDYHSLVPLGIEGFRLHPSHRTLYVMGTARSPYFEGWREIERGPRRVVLAPDGSPVRFFPDHVEFRVTASAMRNVVLETAMSPLEVAEDVNEYLLGLRFQLKVFHGLDARLIEPDQVEMIGMPAVVPYDERVYRAAFRLPRVPVEDRIVLEVLDAAGQRVCKFHLDF